MAKHSSQPQDKYVLRLPDGLREQIKVEAERHGRSMNAEIISRLQGSDHNLRDQFAGHALPLAYAEYASGGTAHECQALSRHQIIAHEAYRMADAMLAERAKTGGSDAS